MRKKTYETPTTTCTLVVSENAIMMAGSDRYMNDGITIQNTNAEGTASDDLFGESVFTSGNY